VRYALGGHNIQDFEKADMVIKNPGVKPDSPYLQAAKRIETDISLFLAASPPETARLKPAGYGLTRLEAAAGLGAFFRRRQSEYWQ